MSLRFEVIAAQSEVIGKKRSCCEKSEVLRIKDTFFIFRLRGLKLNQPGLIDLESRPLEKSGVSLIYNTSIGSRQILTRGPTSAACNSAHFQLWKVTTDDGRVQGEG